MSDRNCLQCSHCLIIEGFRGSDVTPPEGNTFECSKGHWNFDTFSRHHLARCLEMAKACPDFDEDVPPPPPPPPRKLTDEEIAQAAQDGRDAYAKLAARLHKKGGGDQPRSVGMSPVLGAPYGEPEKDA